MSDEQMTDEATEAMVAAEVLTEDAVERLETAELVAEATDEAANEALAIGDEQTAEEIEDEGAEVVTELVVEAEAELEVADALVEVAIADEMVAEAETLEVATEELAAAEALETQPAAEAGAEPAPRQPSARARARARGGTSNDPFRGPGDWYVVHTYAGYENKVKANLESRIKTMQRRARSSASTSRWKT